MDRSSRGQVDPFIVMDMVRDLVAFLAINHSNKAEAGASGGDI
ncbi:hypothetical protein [Cypionkella sp.]|nr:hypothetical protein [Cypionkella sp.]